MNNLRILLALALTFLPLAEASAGAGTITTKDATGVTRTFAITTNGGGNFIANQVICDQSAAATCASVGTAGSPSTNAVTIQAVTLGAGTAANAMRVELPTDGTGKVTAAQATAANLNATVVGTGTFAVQAASTQSGTWTVQPGNTPNTTPWLFKLEDAAGNARGANVNASNQLSVSCDNGCSSTASITGWAGGTLGAMANYGTSPGAVLVPGINAFVTNTNANGQATPANSSPVVQAGMQYETVAVSQTGQVMGGSGATGDYLSHCVAYPVTVSPGVVTVFDSTSSAANNVIAFAGGTSSLSNLSPISFPVGAFSVNGAWKVTTGANVIVTCYGKFSA